MTKNTTPPSAREQVIRLVNAGKSTTTAILNAMARSNFRMRETNEALTKLRDEGVLGVTGKRWYVRGQK